MPQLSDSEFEQMLAGLEQQLLPQKQVDDNPQFPPRLGIDIVGRGITNPAIAAVQLLNEIVGGRGLTSEQLDRYRAMHGPLYLSAIRENPEFVGRPKEPQVYGIADRRSTAEDLNSVKVIYDNWRKQQMGEELTPQERVMQGFVDVRNPNMLSWLRPE